MNKFILVWGFDSITEGTQAFDTAEQAQAYAHWLALAIGVTFAYDALQGIIEHGRYEFGGEWFELRNGAEHCSSHPVAIGGQQ
jgi:hypothetical protein